MTVRLIVLDSRCARRAIPAGQIFQTVRCLPRPRQQRQLARGAPSLTDIVNSPPWCRPLILSLDHLLPGRFHVLEFTTYQKRKQANRGEEREPLLTKPRGGTRSFPVESGSAPRDSITGSSIGIQDSRPAGVDGFQTELELIRGRHPLLGAGENNQSLSFGKAKQLVDGIQVTLR
jgi:hypothetical protein